MSDNHNSAREGLLARICQQDHTCGVAAIQQQTRQPNDMSIFRYGLFRPCPYQGQHDPI